MIIPSIDLMDGRAVQLKQGKTKVKEEADLAKLIRRFRVFPQTNVIDLDAAMGKGSNKELIKSICAKLPCNVGGGIRDKHTAMEYLRAGAKHIIIGTKAEPQFLCQLPKHRTIIALDMKEGRLAIEGWQKTIPADLARKMKELEPHCCAFLVTNINVEGLNRGADMGFIESLKGLTKNRVIVAGGITTYDEIAKISGIGFDAVLGMALYTGKVDLHNSLVACLDLRKGLIPTMAQDTAGQTLMLAYSNEESIRKTLKTGYATYFSRSREKLWKKGEGSGNTQKLLSVMYDCDADTLIYTVRQKGVACHSGRYSCFEDRRFTLGYLREFLKGRIGNADPGSYTAKIAKNEEKLCKKIIEEAFEVTCAKRHKDRVWEVADLAYFVLTYMAKHNISCEEILNELSLRHKE